LLAKHLEKLEYKSKEWKNRAKMFANSQFDGKRVIFIIVFGDLQENSLRRYNESPVML